MRAWGGRAATALARLCIETYGTTCHLCTYPGADTADHVIPRSKGGTNAITNLRPAHGACNSARGNMDLVEWFERHPKPSQRVAPSRRWFG